MGADVRLPVCLAVEVTAEDIAQGEPASAAFCAIARAVKRALGLPDESDDVSVCDGLATVWRGRTTRDYELGLQAVEFAERFDLGWHVEPATFAGRLCPPPSLPVEGIA